MIMMASLPLKKMIGMCITAMTKNKSWRLTGITPDSCVILSNMLDLMLLPKIPNAREDDTTNTRKQQISDNTVTLSPFLVLWLFNDAKDVKKDVGKQ
mmetsp:Transcript_41311/g.47630  ORF Transcript_41311/g.47630 Transcript_41311/m.47630 type:complete len:97 (-) Transcript_41311:422-712(-)